MGGELVTLFLAGDVMLGRGVDQILPHPGDPALPEVYVTDARRYVELAEATNGTIPRPAPFSWPWGEALGLLDAAAPDARILNLETSVTQSDDIAPGKSVHYRMHPANLPCLAAARPDACALANNHVLDYGRHGLADTLGSLAAAGLRTAGAGRDLDEARRPVVLPLPGNRRLLVFSLGTASSGVPHTWAATADRSGIDFVDEASDAAAAEVVGRIRRAKRSGDLVVISIHWGSNWGYAVPRDQIRFAHTLVEGGADVVHGHSSHHPRPYEVYRGHPILYGCGDLIDDYEGIGGQEQYRDDLRLLHFISLEPDTGRLDDARLIPLQAHRMRLRHASREDSDWLREVLARTSRAFGTHIARGPEGTITVHPLQPP
ncbi:MULTISPECIES: CapA family protein [unclassified Streptomyces]|uniref:CapA family protein n=1 Tax=unclassified Streptomyces TaxID=2593676 RepID=UPI001BE8CEB2|nr:MULTISPECIES: CapA family protein [unclassified Streptomyces]MBT2408764.1 CapA family protein [Streptomyces sp. ISL-21]MBT2613824.1 CapA family protein [Streptomyces sp. ISL-87]